ncbi:hypothetical protein J6590_067096 [Homalodisca vitripennis]|nr:hypothetical protein J6590_067096 [Homalodisca vitripennis]
MLFRLSHVAYKLMAEENLTLNAVMGLAQGAQQLLAWLFPVLVTAERSCPSKQLARLARPWTRGGRLLGSGPFPLTEVHIAAFKNTRCHSPKEIRSVLHRPAIASVPHSNKDQVKPFHSATTITIMSDVTTKHFVDNFVPHVRCIFVDSDTNNTPSQETKSSRQPCSCPAIASVPHSNKDQVKPFHSATTSTIMSDVTTKHFVDNFVPHLRSATALLETEKVASSTKTTAEGSPSIDHSNDR